MAHNMATRSTIGQHEILLPTVLLWRSAARMKPHHPRFVVGHPPEHALLHALVDRQPAGPLAVTHGADEAPLRS